MMKPTLFLHVGTHKTGTTSIQEFLYRYRDQMRQFSFLYPDFYSGFTQKKAIISHHRLFRALIGADAKLTEANAIASLERYKDICKSEGCYLVLSSENISRLSSICSNILNQSQFDRSSNYLVTIAQYLKEFNTRPILYLRSHLDYLGSFYAESCRNKFNTKPPSFADYLIQWSLRNPLYYSSLYNTLRRIFGTVSVNSFEESLARPQGLINSFKNAIKLDMESDYDSATNKRPSLSNFAINVKLELFPKIYDVQSNTRINNYLLSSSFKELCLSHGISIAKSNNSTVELLQMQSISAYKLEQLQAIAECLQEDVNKIHQLLDRTFLKSVDASCFVGEDSHIANELIYDQKMIASISQEVAYVNGLNNG